MEPPRTSLSTEANPTTSVLRRARSFVRGEFDAAFRHDLWNLGVADVPIATFLDPDARPNIRWVPRPGRGSYYADPFAVRAGEKVVIFCERYYFRGLKGVICALEVGPDGTVSKPRDVLELPVHASYPFLVRRDGGLYCVPESAAAREVGLYRIEDSHSPASWTKVATLLRGVAALDSTIFERDGRWWLVCTDLYDGPESKLRVWHAPDLLGPWEPHAKNPVKTDMGSARPAGTPFVVDGDLYRPAQDSSRTYGGAVVLNRIVDLTPTSFLEEPAAIVRPAAGGPYPLGIHTLSSVGDMTVLDGKRKVFSWHEMKHNVREGWDSRWKASLWPSRPSA